MKNYFRLDLSGGKIFLWWLLYLAGIVLAVTLMRGGSITPETIVGGGMLRGLLLQFLSVLIIMVFGLLFLFFIVRATVRGLSCGEERFSEDFDLGRFLGLAVKGILLTAITFGIYFPWFATSVMRYFAGGTSFRHTPLAFGGNGMTLFGIMVLAMVLPYGLLILLLIPIMTAAATFDFGMFLVWVVIFLILALLVVSAYRYLLLRWGIDFQWGGRRITFRAGAGNGIAFILGQMLLSVVTLFLYLPAAYIRIWRYVASHTVCEGQDEEKRFGMTPNIWQDYFYILGQGVLTVITFGIYGSWALAGVMRRLVSRIYVEEASGKAETLPAE